MNTLRTKVEEKYPTFSVKCVLGQQTAYVKLSGL